MGARQGSIIGIFLFQGAMIGFAGAAAGVVLGLGVCFLLQKWGFPLDPKVYFIDKLPVVVRPGDFLIAAGVASGLCLGAGLVPSWWAARLSPVDGLRYE
jgi:lipoprotein-releasing system permease protein